MYIFAILYTIMCLKYVLNNGNYTNMKAYYDYMAELSVNDVRKGLLGYGLFADKLPNFLSAEAFFIYCNREGFPTFTQKGGWDYVRYDSIRNTNITRGLAIPTPFAYSNLCNGITSQWSEILSHFQIQSNSMRYKHSQIHIQKLDGKPYLFEMTHNYPDKDEYVNAIIQRLPIKKRYIVKADISSCFPSIYSHAISWALVGKDTAKAHRNDDVWYNKLDEQSRHLKYNETCGLLIGPHSSNILSEIILTTIDAVLSEKYDFVRYIDDYTCYVFTEDEAERFLLDLSCELKKFELSLNVKKTIIARLPLSLDISWVNAINGFYIGGEKKEDDKKIIFRYARLKAFIDMCMHMVDIIGDSAVYNYMIKVVSSCYLGKKARLFYIDIVHHLLLLYPYLAHCVEEYVFVPFSVSKERIEEIANQLYEFGLQKHLYEACSYALYWAVKYDFNITSAYVDEAIQSGDCIFLLLSYIKSNHIKDSEGQHKLIEEAINRRNEIDKYWLFVYEVLPKTKLVGDYKRIKNKGITFLQSEFQLRKK